MIAMIAGAVNHDTCAYKWLTIVLTSLNKGYRLDSIEMYECTYCTKGHQCWPCPCNSRMFAPDYRLEEYR